MTSLTIEELARNTIPGVSKDSNLMENEFSAKLKYYFFPISAQLSNPAMKFEILKNRWLEETCFLSSTTNIVLHPDYQKIIGMGKDAIPLILNEMRLRPDHWFWALKSITGEDPVMPEYRGKIKKMTECWLKWGKKQGYIK